MKTLTIQIPDDVMSALERTARQRERPVAEEASEWLRASARTQDKLAEAEFIERVRQTRAKLASAGVWITPDDIRKGIEEGRK